MRVERRGRVVRVRLAVNHREVGGADERAKPKDKPFAISKWVVWEAYQRVKANDGAAGVDGESIEEFERDLKGNLYKLWNRLSSGSYFPAPVRAVEIPKKHGQGVRVLGVPTVADRIAQTVVRLYLEPKVEPMFHPDSYGYRPGRSALQAVGVCRERCWRSGLGDRPGHPSLLRQSVPTSSCCERYARHTDERWILLYVERWLKAPLQQEDGTLVAAGSRHAARLSDLTVVGQPVLALRVRHVDGEGVSRPPVRTLLR